MKDPRILLEFIIECADRLAEYVGEVTREEFDENYQKQDAVFRRLEVLGQAVKDLPDTIRETYPDIEWRKIAGMRDKLSHDYLGIDIDITWKSATEDVPKLRTRVVQMLQELAESDFS